MKKPGSGRRNKAWVILPELLAGGLVAFLLLPALLPSCRNDMETIRSLEVVDTLPALTARDIEIIYSEKGQAHVRLISPYLVSKEEDEPLLIFPEGFTIYFYDTLMNVTSTITADYGLSREKKKLMEARHNVIVENVEKDETLNTEELFWDRAKEIIYSEKTVRITSGGQVIIGEGLYSKQPFDKLEVYKTTGVLEIKEEPAK
jgi:LPS export ABC transporter protein LptC